MGACWNRLYEAVLACIHTMCFGQKCENSQNISSENCIFTTVKICCMLHGRVIVIVG